MRKSVLLSVLWLFTGYVWGDGGDLLKEDEPFALVMEAPAVQAEATAKRHGRFTLSHFMTQSDALVRWRSSARYEYERSLAEGHYLRLDGKLRRFHSSDSEAERRGEAYHKAELDALWWQWSEGNCFAKLGRQGVYWGRVDNSFVLDQFIPFDYTEALLTSFTGLRQPEDLMRVQCYHGAHQVQILFNPRPRLSVFAHQRSAEIEELEDQLKEEAGVRWQWSIEGRELALMWARLEDNVVTPILTGGAVPYESQVARFDLWGLSMSQSWGAMLFSLDLAYHQDQFQAFSADTRDEWEAALGVEYTSTGNHRFNGGIWRYRAQPIKPGDQVKQTEVMNVGWRKSYWRDELDMSLLGLWGGRPRIASLTALADYQWSDHWSTQLSVSAAELSDDAEAAVPGVIDGWSASASINWVY